MAGHGLAVLPAMLLLACAPISTSSFSMAHSAPLPAFASPSPVRGWAAGGHCARRAQGTCCAPPAAAIARTSFMGMPPLRGGPPRELEGTGRGRRGGRAGWTCLFGSFDGVEPDDWSDYMDDEDWEGDRMVVLRDTAADRVIECFIDRELEVEGKRYATLMPADTPVIIAAYEVVNGTEQLVPMLEDHEVDRLFDTAAAVLAEMDLLLSRSAVVLTVEGGMIEGDEYGSQFDISEGESEDDDEDNFSSGGPVSLRMEELVDSRGRAPSGLLGGFDEDTEDEDEENEKVQVLATFFFEGKRHVVAAPLEPVLIIGSPAPVQKLQDWSGPNEMKLLVGERANNLGDDFDANDLFGDSEEEEYHLPDKEELERVTPIIERELENLHESEVQEKKKLLNLRASLQKQWNSNQ